MYNCCISGRLHRACTEYFYVVESFFNRFAGFDVSFDKIRKFCMKFGYLPYMVLRKITKFVATNCQNLRLKFRKFPDI